MIIGEFELESPLMNAGGVVKTIEDVRIMAGTGVGAIVLGSYTLEPRPGNGPNGEKVYYHDDSSGITYNSLGMPNKGIKAVAPELPEMIKIAHDLGKPVILNIAPVSDDPATEIIDIFDELSSAGIHQLDAVELNAGCPNVVMADGSRHELLSHHPNQLEDVLAKIEEVAMNEIGIGSIFVRISPLRDEQDAANLMQALSWFPMIAVSAFNTFPGGRPVNANGLPILQVRDGVGGQSGRGMRGKAEELTRWLVAAREKAGLDFDVIGSNGITDGESLKKRLELGPKAVSCTTIFYESTSWAAAVDKILREYADLVS